jgi:hypothetical protein
MTRKPLFWNNCCCELGDVSSSNAITDNSVELQQLIAMSANNKTTKILPDVIIDGLDAVIADVWRVELREQRQQHLDAAD